MSNKGTVREQICNLNAARKGSLLESFYKAKVNPLAEFVRNHGVGADIKLPDGEYIDLKLHRHQPRPVNVALYWADYLTESSEKCGMMNIYKIEFPNIRTHIHEIPNTEFESYFLNEWKNKNKQKPINGDSENRGHKKDALISAAKEIILKEFPEGKTRFLARQRKSAYGDLTVLPPLWPDNGTLLDEFNRTILIVGDNNWDKIEEYWVFDHTTDQDILRPFLENDGRGKYRIRAINFPESRIFQIETDNLQ